MNPFTAPAVIVLLFDVFSLVPKMPAPSDLLLDLAQRDMEAAMRFCAVRPKAAGPHAWYTDVDETCSIVFGMKASGRPQSAY